MDTPVKPPFLKLDRPEPAIDVDRRDDGSIVVASAYKLGPITDNLCLFLRRSAAEHPDRTFLAKRDGGGDWWRMSYAEAVAGADAVTQWLLDRSVERPVMILSENSIEHALMALGAMAAGLTVVPVSPAYSLLSQDFGKLRYIFDLIRPSVVFVQDEAAYRRALDVLDLTDIALVSVTGESGTLFADIERTEPGPAVARALAAVGGDTVAKILFTSGSTGMPKGVVNTHAMLCAAQEMAAAVAEPPEPERPPVILDWLPWHHTFGGNAGFNAIMRGAGTLYIDEGRPVPGRFETTIANLREISPTRFSSVPAALAMLAEALEKDDALRVSFFKNLRGLLYGGASMPQATYDRYQALAIDTLGLRIPFASGYGMTETSSVNTAIYWETERMGLIGLPFPGMRLKLVPFGDKYEVRVKGPHVMAGYLERPDLNETVFDEEGFFKTGDAARWADPDDPLQGLAFAGRVAEEFKLASGTWVQAGALRIAALNALAPLVQDTLVAGQDRDFVGLLAWPNLAACRALADDLPADAPADRVVAHPAVRRAVAERLARYNETHGAGSMRLNRLMLMTEPPSIDGHEITDKQYINQRAALDRRADLVERLYASSLDADVILSE